MHVAGCKEFHAILTVRNNGICEYVKDIWEEDKYCKPLEITKKFANNDLITVARRMKSTEMKPFQRFLHFIVMKNVAPRVGKRDTTSFMDLTYMDHLLTRRLVNLPRVMLRHVDYVISVENHELSYGDWLTMVFEAYNLRRIDGIWWLGMEQSKGFEWEAVNEEAEIQGESGSAKKFYDAEDEVQGSANVSNEVREVSAPVSDQQKEKAAAGVDPSVPTGSTPDPLLQHFQAELDRAPADRL
ncbi:hypothetical protein Dimus_003451 [Dionaea muscipula]